VGAGASGDAAAGSCVARWRDDELALLLPATALDDAVAVVDRLRRAVARDVDGVTLSAGVVAVRAGAALEGALDEAERQLTAARLAGGDRVAWPGAPAARDEDARTVLVAEDDEVVAALLRHRLTREGFTVVHARDGLAALDVAAARPLALAVLDILMPGLDGFEVLTRLRQTERGAHIPILMLTGLGNERDVERALALGANDYVIKPFSPVEVTARVHRLLRRG
jgi:PleD family two-component response regulator